jgi:putative Holliday junction resolvase
MGLDIGDKRTGVALSDPGEILASPFTIIERNDEEHDIAAIIDIITQDEIGKIIVGLPRSMAGTIGHQATRVEAFVERLRNHTEIPIEFQDERLSTVSARQLMQSTGRKAKKEPRYDAAAAAVILQDYLEAQR